MSDSPGKATFTLLFGLLTVVMAAAATASLLGARAPEDSTQESAQHAGLTTGEALELKLMAHKQSPAFEAAVDAIAGPRAALVMTHLLFVLTGADQSRRFYVADTLKLQIQSPELDQLLSAYLHAQGAKGAAAQAALLDWALARVPASARSLRRS